MLILTRKKNESIIIDDNIEVVITGIEDGKVRVGIKAPKDIEIHRKEIYEQIQHENKVAVSKGQINIDALKEIFENTKNQTD